MSKETIIQDMLFALQAALAKVQPDTHLTWKSMFGGAGFFADGRIFAAWFGGSLALKLPEDARRELLAVEGTTPAQSAQYVEVPPGFLEQTERLESWVARSLDYVQSSPAKGRER